MSNRHPCPATPDILPGTAHRGFASRDVTRLKKRAAALRKKEAHYGWKMSPAMRPFREPPDLRGVFLSIMSGNVKNIYYAKSMLAGSRPGWGVARPVF
jgi:hypothetical protein